MTRPRVLHLVDDTTAGGVTRVLDHIATSPRMARDASHRVETIQRGAVSLRHRSADIIVSHLSISWSTLPALAALRARHPRTPMVHVEHSYTRHFVALRVARPVRFTTLLRTPFALFDRVVAVSDGQAAWLRAARLVRASRVIAIASCVDLAPFRALPPPPSKPRVIGAIGRLDEQKGFDLLIRAFRRLDNPAVSLHIYGEGPEKQHLQSLAQGDARIAFRGWASNPADAVDGVDCVVMPSRWEAYGLVAIEALAAGRPVLTSGIDGLSDHVKRGARSVATDTPEDWGAALTDLTQGVAPPAVPLPYRQQDMPEQAFALGWKKLVEDLFQTVPA